MILDKEEAWKKLRTRERFEATTKVDAAGGNNTKNQPQFGALTMIKSAVPGFDPGRPFNDGNRSFRIS